MPAFSEEDDKSNVLLQQATPHSSSHPSHSSSQGQNGVGQSQQQQTVGVVRLNSTDSSKGNTSPAQIIAASPTALATATQVGVDGVNEEIKIEFKIELHETTFVD